MANVGSPARGYYPDHTMAVGAVKTIVVKFTVGSSGAVASQQTLGEIQSITRTGTGAYTIQFTQSYYQSVGMFDDTAQASYSAGGAVNVVHIADANEAVNGTLKIQITTAAGAAVEAASGDVVTIQYNVQVDSITS